MAEPASDYHRGNQDITEAETTYRAFGAMSKWGSLAIGALLVLLVLWFCTPAGFFPGAIAAVILTTAGIVFLRDKPAPRPALPIELDGARILSIEGKEVFSAYVPSPKGPVFMSLIEKTFGKELTTRTWDTVAKVAR